MRYKNISKNKENGVVYTPSKMADYVSNTMKTYHTGVYNEKLIKILDPAAGKGELLNSMINTLRKDGFNNLIVVGYETDKDVAYKTQKMLCDKYPDVVIDIKVGDFIEEVGKGTTSKFDYVIANPPYIRTQILGAEKAQELSEKLNLSGKVDIYYVFLLYALNVLKNNGVAGYITSNKFMKIKSGKSVRNFMLDNYKIHHITDLGDTKMFNASVLPCIIVFSPGETKNKEKVLFTSVYEEQNDNACYAAPSVFDFINKSGTIEINNGKKYKVQQGHLISANKDELWGIITNKDVEFIKNVEKNTWTHFSDLGKIRVGIKTTADNVFISEDWNKRYKNIELLRPLITHRNAGQIISEDDKYWQVLYTHEMKDGKKAAVNLEDYPNSFNYLKSHFKQLNSRNYLKKANRNWFEIWVPQDPDAWKYKKIIFRDIVEEPQFWLDESGAIVNGDCYWIEIDSNINDDLVYLALAIGNSTFIEKYYDIRFNNKLYSGKRRFQSQYVKEFPIPYVGKSSAQESIKLVKKIIANQKYTDSDKKKLNDLVFEMFNC